MLKQFAHFLLRQPRNAALVALIFGILPAFFASFSMVIVSLITLCRGYRAGALVMMWAILPFLAHAYVNKSIILLLLALGGFILVWLMSILLRATHSWALLLQAAMLLGVIGVFVAHWVYPNLVAWWVQYLTNYLSYVHQTVAVDASTQAIKAQIHWFASIATGFQATIILLLATLKVIFARWWQALVFNPGGLRKELHQIRLGGIISALMLVLIIVAYSTQSMVVVEAIFPLVLGLAVAGISVLHYWLRPYKYALIALFGFYLVLVILPKLIFLMVLLGMIDSGINLRKKMSS